MKKIKTSLSKKAPDEYLGDNLMIILRGASKELDEYIDTLDSRISNLISDHISDGNFSGAEGETTVLTLPAELPFRRIILAGAGNDNSFNNNSLRKAVSSGIRQAERFGGKSGIYISGFQQFTDSAKMVFTVFEASFLALYRFDLYKSTINKTPKKSISAISLLLPGKKIPASLSKSIDEARTICEAVYFGRDIINLPANDFNTGDFAAEARKIGRKANVKTTVYKEAQLKRMGMNAVLSVGRGSENPSMLITMEYNGGKQNGKPLVMVGKGVTFDSGGLSLKSAANMVEMKQDMGGAGVVMSAFKAAVELQLKINLVAIIATVENMPSGSAYRPSDVIKTHSGLTVEIINTDAEGRLILADALSYSKKFKPSAVIDVATLTGASKVALGTVGCAVMSFHKDLIEKIYHASENTDEKAWELPLWDEFNKQIKSDIADFKNSGGREGGAITAGLFLSKFIEGEKWAHIDMANVDYAYSETPITRKGASGFGIRLLVDFLKNWK
ncbi:MAG: leucyl aminopeptidase [candidate division Zixibacteria bacterium]|nr:leucyl aminopeptidase [candidate division Zixibacteria bacterium]